MLRRVHILNEINEFIRVICMKYDQIANIWINVAIVVFSMILFHLSQRRSFDLTLARLQSHVGFILILSIPYQ